MAYHKQIHGVSGVLIKSILFIKHILHVIDLCKYPREYIQSTLFYKVYFTCDSSRYTDQ